MSSSSFVDVIAALLLLFLISSLVVYTWFKLKFTYWQRRGVEGPTPSFPFGNYSEVFGSKAVLGDFLKRLYFEYKDKRFVGTYIFFQPTLVVTDSELTSRILGPDMTHFDSHGPEITEKVDPLGVHLFNASGKKWKELRMKLTPAFSSGKMKNMFMIMDKIGDELQQALKISIEQKKKVELRDLMARYTTDVIGNCAFGLECNSLKYEDAAFRRCGQRIINHNKMEEFKIAIGFFFPGICSLLGISPQKKDVIEFIHKSVNDTVEYREKNDIKRNDFLELLLQLKNGTLTDDKGKKVEFGGLTENEFMSQVYLFFLAGFETSSSTASFALYELACNPDIQEKARLHVHSVLKKHNGQYTYDALNDMDYLTHVIDESLRLYPPLVMLTRKCNADYKVPDSKLVIEKDTMVFLSVLGPQMDPEYFPKPEKFDPDRFNSENWNPRLNKIYMPFGYGPRNCIGQRFGMLQTKVALAKLLDKYTFSVTQETDVPMKMKKGFYLPTPLNGIYLNANLWDK